MALKIGKDGKVKVTSPDEAAKALQLVVETKEAIKEDLELIEEYREAVADYMARAHINQIDIPELDKHGTLIQRHTSIWDRKVLLKLLKTAKPKTWKKVWQAMTTRQPDPEKIQEAIKDGLISADDIDDAFIQKPQKPFVQVYDD